jgi:hypothetical protein
MDAAATGVADARCSGPDGMTEAEARDLLRDWPGVGGLEVWIADQDWSPAPGGWSVEEALGGRRFRIEIVGDGLRRCGGEPGAEQPAVWLVQS